MNRLCEEIQGQAAGLASLAPGDRERRMAEAHALTCAPCAMALAEGAAVLSLVDEALPLEAPHTEALARARDEILAEMAGGSPLPQLPPSGSRRGRSPATMLIGGLAVLPLLSLALALLKSGPAGLQAAVGFTCAAFELAFAAGPLVATFVLARRGHVGHPIIAVAAGAAAGALVGQAALHFACHALPSTSHALTFHALPVLLALTLGALAGVGVQRGAERRRSGPPT